MAGDLWSIVWRSFAIAVFTSGFLSAFGLVAGGFWHLFVPIFFGSIALGAVVLFVGKVSATAKKISQYVFAGLAYVLAVLTVSYALDAPLIVRPAGGGFPLPIYFTDDPRLSRVAIPSIALLGLLFVMWSGWLVTKLGQRVVTAIYVAMLLLGVADLIGLKYFPSEWYTVRATAEGKQSARILVQSHRSAIEKYQQRKGELEGISLQRSLSKGEVDELTALDKKIAEEKEALKKKLEGLEPPHSGTKWRMCANGSCLAATGTVIVGGNVNITAMGRDYSQVIKWDSTSGTGTWHYPGRAGVGKLALAWKGGKLQGQAENIGRAGSSAVSIEPVK